MHGCCEMSKNRFPSKGSATGTNCTLQFDIYLTALDNYIKNQRLAL